MNGLPEHYASPLHLPFNRTCLEGQFLLQGPADDPGGPGYGLLLHGSSLLIKREQERFVLPHGEWPAESALYLGLWKGQPCRLVDLKATGEVAENLERLSLVDDNPQLPIGLLSLGGMGRMILHWERRSRFCGCCGLPMDWLGAWGRSCKACGNHQFPAIHPCAIVLVCRPGEVLLTRKPNWAPNRYSLVAGFQDFGESLEETALREVAEETGIVAGNIRYVGSQCWPFPSQVMVGFVAEYVDGEIQLDAEELEDARWFSVEALPELPPKRSIARYILDTTLKLP